MVGRQNFVAHYGARIQWHELSDNLLKAVDAVLSAQGGGLPAALNRLRAVRSTMLKVRAAEAKRERGEEV